jgi:hypothetical protein
MDRGAGRDRAARSTPGESSPLIESPGSFKIQVLVVGRNDVIERHSYRKREAAEAI